MVNGWATIDCLRTVSYAGIPYAKQVVAAEDRSLVASLISSGNLEKFIIGIKDEGDLQRTGDFLREKLTEQAIKNAAYSIDAASLVFAHTILDDALSAFLEITSQVAPAFWRKRIEKKKIEVSELKDDCSFAEILSPIIAKEIATIRRNASLIEKCNLLHQICKPKAGTMPATDYKFDSAILLKLDQVRHDVIHGDQLGKEMPETEKNLKYLRDTWNYFFMLMHKSFGLRIDPAVMSKPRFSPNC